MRSDKCRLGEALKIGLQPKAPADSSAGALFGLSLRLFRAAVRMSLATSAAVAATSRTRLRVRSAEQRHCGDQYE
jgi:hypothetical protein